MWHLQHLLLFFQWQGCMVSNYRQFEYIAMRVVHKKMSCLHRISNNEFGREKLSWYIEMGVEVLCIFFSITLIFRIKKIEDSRVSSIWKRQEISMGGI